MRCKQGGAYRAEYAIPVVHPLPTNTKHHSSTTAGAAVRPSECKNRASPLLPLAASNVALCQMMTGVMNALR